MALQHLPSTRRITAGFTLIEVMIVVAIIGILAGIAYPAYTDYVRRGQIQEAFTQLSTFRAKMEQYYLDNKNYGTATGCASDSSASSWNTFAGPSDGRFTYTCTTSSPFQSYTITATGNAGAATGNVYTIDQDGTRRTTRFKGTTLSAPASCWLTKGATC
ncbi:MAG: type IV pilin protein [Aquabacterium sp.]